MDLCKMCEGDGPSLSLPLDQKRVEDYPTLTQNMFKAYYSKIAQPNNDADTILVMSGSYSERWIIEHGSNPGVQYRAKPYQVHKLPTGCDMASFSIWSLAARFISHRMALFMIHFPKLVTLRTFVETYLLPPVVPAKQLVYPDESPNVGSGKSNGSLTSHTSSDRATSQLRQIQARVANNSPFKISNQDWELHSVMKDLHLLWYRTHSKEDEPPPPFVDGFSLAPTKYVCVDAVKESRGKHRFRPRDQNDSWSYVKYHCPCTIAFWSYQLNKKKVTKYLKSCERQDISSTPAGATRSNNDYSLVEHGYFKRHHRDEPKPPKVARSLNCKYPHMYRSLFFSLQYVRQWRQSQSRKLCRILM